MYCFWVLSAAIRAAQCCVILHWAIDVGARLLTAASAENGAHVGMTPNCDQSYAQANVKSSLGRVSGHFCYCLREL